MNKSYIALLLGGSGLVLTSLYLSQEGNESNAEHLESVSRISKSSNHMHKVIAALSQGESVPTLALRDLFSDPRAVSSPLGGKNIHSNKSEQNPKSVNAQFLDKVSTPPLLRGVVLRKSGNKAFFTEKDNLYSVGTGGVVGNQYRIIRIREKSVLILDMATGDKRTMYIKD